MNANARSAARWQSELLTLLIQKLGNDELAKAILDKAMDELLPCQGGWDFYNLAITRMEQAITRMAIPVCLYASEYEEIIKAQDIMDDVTA